MTDKIEPFSPSVFHDRFPNHCTYCGGTSLEIQVRVWLLVEDAKPKFLHHDDILLPKKGALVICPDCGGQFRWKPLAKPDSDPD